MKFLIWIAGSNGPEPQLCYEEPVDGSGKAKPYLAKHKIDEDDRRNLFQLSQAFPAPE